MLNAISIVSPTIAHRDSAPVTKLTDVTINDFSRDRLLFDSGVAFGGSSASVTFSGTGTIGEVVEFRLRFDGGVDTAWAPAATIDQSGTWSSEVEIDRSPLWLRIEVRIQSEPTTRAIAANRIGVGHVVALWGQSEIARIAAIANNPLPAPNLSNLDMVQVLMGGQVPEVSHLDSNNGSPSALVNLANTFMAERPSEKFAIIFHAVPGTGLKALVDDGDSQRLWSEDLSLHQFATVDGAKVGLAAISWFATPSSVGTEFGAAFLPLFSGKDLSGSDVTFPTDINYGSGQSYRADHWFGELYDYSETKWLPFGPHRFDISEDMLSATTKSDGQQQAGLRRKQDARMAWREMLESPGADGVFLPLGAEPIAYQNGEADTLAGWTDISHPGSQDADGLNRYAKLVAHSVLQGAGLTSWTVPEFDNCEWESGGSYVDVWSSAGPVTTIRVERGETAPASAYPHRTEVLGWQINGLPAEQAVLREGKVRIFPISTPFSSGDVLTFGEGGSTGMIKFPEDQIDELYKDIPIVDVGAIGVEGVSVRPLPDATVLENTLVSGDSSFATTATGPHFADVVNLGTGISRISSLFDAEIQLPASGASTLFNTTGNYFRLEILPNGSVRLRVRDDVGDWMVNAVTSAVSVVNTGVRQTIGIGADLQAGWAKVWIDGVEVISETFSSSTGVFPSNRSLLLFAMFNGTSQVVSTAYDVRVWIDADPSGPVPATPVYKALTGPSSAVNSDPWKLGDDAV